MSKNIFRYSEINTAYTCLQKYKYIYLDGIKPEIESGDMAFGTACHLGIEACLEKDSAEITFTSFWNTQKDKPLKYTRDNWESLLNKGQVFMSRFERLHLKNYEPAYIEQKCSIQLGGFTIQGTPDYIGLYKGVPSIVDFKTSGMAYDIKKLHSNEQMFIYAKMAQDLYNMDIKQLVYCVLVKNPEPRIQVITLPLTQDKHKSMLDNVVLMMQDLSKRESFPRNRNNCGYCEFFTKCYGEIK